MQYDGILSEPSIAVKKTMDYSKTGKWWGQIMQREKAAIFPHDSTL